ncbi:hypothetical protein ACNKU7_01930 [Microbulbifer sp. SA54]|uniref:hypothetical protein n=1 Tax=Microbulbifer sp. SA54 TaxID=3401577 RepID=UPI003AAF1F02
MRTPLPLILSTLCAVCLPLLADHVNAAERSQPELDGVAVLIATDHTRPGEYSEASNGAEGRERDYIDPAADYLAGALRAQGLTVEIARVEEQLPTARIANKLDFDNAYAAYDDLLRSAVHAGSTIVALHFDADRLPPEASLADAEYVGGAQIIVDDRSLSASTKALATQLLEQDKILQTLARQGARLRPDYTDKLRMQKNQTLHIAGKSSGGAFLLELAPQQQAREQFGNPQQVTRALGPALDQLAEAIARFRSAQL